MALAAPLADPTAVIGRRVAAAVIDGLIVTVPTFAAVTSQMEYITRDRVGSAFDDFCDQFMDQQDGLCVQVGDKAYFDDTAASPAGTLTFFVLSIGLLVVLQGLAGWTVGKVVMGLRTVKEDGSVPGLGKAFVRWLLLLIDSLPCIPLIGFITAASTNGHRRVGDMAAKTFVVRASAAGSPINVPGLTLAAPAGYAVPAAYGTPTTPPGGWGGPPATPTAAPPTAPTAPASAPAGSGSPQWDQARGTYIQWDAAQGRWLQWDEATRTWSTIPGQ
jgi:uncharacterized RDD family membrane protein YckC